MKKLEKLHDVGNVLKPGKSWTVEGWLTHWVEEFAPLAVGENTMAALFASI